MTATDVLASSKSEAKHGSSWWSTLTPWRSKEAEIVRLSKLNPAELQREYEERARQSWDTAWELLHSDGWRLECGEGLEEGLVHSKRIHKIGNIYKLEAYVNCSPEELFHELVIDVETGPSWNPTILACKIVKSINDCTDICYNATGEAAGGLVSSRDFVNLRHWKTRDGIILSSGCAIVHPQAPTNKKHIRGENGPGGWVFKPVAQQPNVCHFCWILNTDLKGWIPTYAVDRAISGMLMEFLGNIRKRMADKKSS